MKKNNLGLIHIYCGDGKGKTSAAIGQAIRAAGAGYRVLIARFLKNNHSSELNILNNIPNIEIMLISEDFGFVFNMSESTKDRAKQYYTKLFTDTCKKAIKEYFDVLILDEINVAVSLGMIDENLVLDFLSNNNSIEIILTGRNPSDNLLKLADYISDIHKIKHPYDSGVSSRIGIEE